MALQATSIAAAQRPSGAFQCMRAARQPFRLQSRRPLPAARPVRRQVVTRAGLDAGTLAGAAAFLAPGAGILVYAFIIGKGNLRDGLSRVLTQVSQGYFQPDVGGENIPVAEGELSDLAGDEPLFKALYKWFIESGGVYKLVFGPKAFIVVSDPVVVRHLLRENAYNYDKGVLAEILEPIMGKGLIPADLETWKVRRRQIVPAFHKAYLEASLAMFGRCTQRTVTKFDAALAQPDSTAVVDMEAEFLSLGLDIIGLGVFNYDFGSFNSESPVIKAVYGVLKEAEHRSTFYIPYWNLPLAEYLVPRQAAFRRDLAVINECLDGLIAQAKSTRQADDIEALQARDYSRVQDASLLRFLVDMRDADLEAKQLRDDLMTMLIAGHETTAAVLTWTMFMLAQHPDQEAKVLAEIDQVVGDSHPSEFQRDSLLTSLLCNYGGSSFGARIRVVCDPCQLFACLQRWSKFLACPTSAACWQSPCGSTHSRPSSSGERWERTFCLQA